MAICKLIDSSKRVYVYRNLHKNCWSIRQGGLIVQHCSEVSLQCVRFLVGEMGRQRVLREKRKNVHAGISGYITNNLKDTSHGVPVVYNPYKYKTFIRALDSEPIKFSAYASLSIDNGVFAFEPNVIPTKVKFC